MREHEEGATAREVAGTIAPMRHQDGGCPASQWVRLDTLVDELVGRLARDIPPQSCG